MEACLSGVSAKRPLRAHGETGLEPRRRPDRVCMKMPSINDR